MKVDHVLILAAGKGTRMGSIGTVLPKVIWPVFHRSIMELEVLYANMLAPKAQIYINIYNYKNILKKYLKKHEVDFSEVTILEEMEELDIGGAVHNLAKQVGYKGNLLILNSDQFLFSNDDLIEKALSELESSDSVLFSYEFKQEDGYSALDIKDKDLKGIIANKDLKKSSFAQTYTGMSLINLAKIDQCSGRSSFFSSVANPLKNKVRVIEAKNLEYWDFGTVNRYHFSMFELLKNRECLFYKFLEKTLSIDTSKNRINAYNGTKGINLSSNPVELEDGEIFLGPESRDLKERNKEDKNIILGDLIVTANY